MLKLFLSYRRKDTIAAAGRIFDRLEEKYGRNAVFMDVDAIPFGVDFRVHLAEQVAQCTVFLAVIGPNWLGITANGDRRIDNRGDFVRIEVESALNRGIPVVPILIGGCPMPSGTELPASLSELSFRNGLVIDNGRDFNIHIDRLIRGIDHLVAEGLEKARKAATSSGGATTRSSSMMCEKCKAPAAIHVYEIEARESVSTAHLCEKCAEVFLVPQT